jgi:1-acyl-sn-glycerol-3-phosphate acyltransferase
MRVLLTLYQIIAYYTSFALFVVLSFGLNLFCLLTGWLPGMGGRERFYQRLVHWDFALFVWFVSSARIVPVHYKGFGRWPQKKGSGLVVVANHPGLMDVGWLLARLPEAMCVYKPDVGHNPLFGATARYAGYLASNRGHHLLRAAAAKLAAGHTLLVFPEGTRTRGDGLNPLKPGFVAMAREAKVPIQLVRIGCDSELLTKARPWWLVPRLPATVTVSLGPCLPPPGDDTAAVVHEIEDWFRDTPPGIRAVRAELQPAPVHVRT